LFLKPDADHRRAQVSLLAGKLGQDDAQQIRQQADLLAQLDRQFKLPLLELGFPTLRKLPPQRLAFYLELASDLVGADNHVDPHEFALLQVLTVYVHDIATPEYNPPRRIPGRSLKKAVSRVFAYLAWAGQADEPSAEAAYRAALASAFPGQAESQMLPFSPPEQGFPPSAADMQLLDRLPSEGKRRLLQGLARLVEHDGIIQVQEAELLRCVAASVHIPLPPFLVPSS
jgi:hypothetical protein